jgi:hypothetical protein
VVVEFISVISMPLQTGLFLATFLYRATFPSYRNIGIESRDTFYEFSPVSNLSLLCKNRLCLRAMGKKFRKIRKPHSNMQTLMHSVSVSFSRHVYKYYKILLGGSNVALRFWSLPWNYNIVTTVRLIKIKFIISNNIFWSDSESFLPK